MEEFSVKINERMQHLHDQLMEDVKLEEINLHDRTLRSPAIKTKWLRIMFEERRLVKKLSEHRQKLISDYVRTHGRPDVPKNIEKIQLEAEAKRSDNIIRVDNAIENQKEVVDFVEQAVKIVLSSFSYDIKNSIDIVKIES